VTVAAIVFALAFLPMAFEARLSARHEGALRAAGANEPAEDVYRWMQIAYPAAFVTMAIEAAIRRAGLNQVFALGIAVFIAGKAIKYWAIATLGSRWTFRVLVPPSSSLITHGPYRYLRHPNYVGVIGELLGLAIAARATVSGAISVLLFAILIGRRIRVEERALYNAGRR
jgi:methyltransferase